MLRTLLILFLFLSFSGCSSLSYRTSKNNAISPGPYPGVRTDVEELGDSREDGEMESMADPIYNMVAFFDLPFSFIADTLCLPYDVFQVDKVEENSEPQSPVIDNRSEK